VTFSDDVRVMLRPFSVYRELGAGEEREPLRTAAVRAGFMLLVLGAFVSLTTAGRLVAFHVASVFIGWAFLPGFQALAVVLAIRTVAPNASVRRALSLYFTGLAPWLLWMLLVAIVPLVVPDVYRTMMWLVRRGVIPALLLVAIGWGGVLTYACFRAGLDLSRRRAAAATAVFYAVFVGGIVGYYLVMNQIQPQFPGIP
jgi:Yip1 domain